MSYYRTARRLGTVHTFTMSGTSQQTAAFGAQTRSVRVATSAQPAYVRVSADPTAVNTDSIVPAGWVEDITVNPGEKLAVLQAGTAGTLTVTELS